METGTDLEKSSFLSPVKNMSVLLLLGGFGSLFIVLPLLIVNTLLGIIELIIAVGLMATSFGLRKMKKWGFYGYVAITLLNVVGAAYYFIAYRTMDIVILIQAVVLVLFLLYFWRISKKFN